MTPIIAFIMGILVGAVLMLVVTVAIFDFHERGRR